MIIDDVDITEFGMKRLRIDGHLDHPQRKRILAQPEFLANDIRFDEFDVNVKLICRQSTLGAASAAIDNLKDLLKEKPVHRFRDIDLGLDFMGIVKQSIRVDAHGRILVVNMKVTVTQCTTGNLIT